MKDKYQLKYEKYKSKYLALKKEGGMTRDDLPKISTSTFIDEFLDLYQFLTQVTFFIKYDVESQTFEKIETNMVIPFYKIVIYQNARLHMSFTKNE